jgi:YD repeat-containing protein
LAESDEEKAGVILDYDEQGNLLATEILDASRRVSDPRKIDYEAIE